MAETKRRFAVILNAKARHGKQLAQTVKDELGELAEFIVLADKQGDQEAAITRAKKEGIKDMAEMVRFVRPPPTLSTPIS